MLTPMIGKRYLNGKKEIVTIVGVIEPGAGDYVLGHRFIDQNGTGYTEEGMFNKNNPAHAFNLVGELPDTIGVTNAVVTEEPGFFTHLGNKLSENPLSTMLGLTVVAGAGYAAYNYQTTGSVTGQANDVSDIAEATAAFLGGSWK